MAKRSFLLVLLFVSSLLLGGCETVKGFATGFESIVRGIGDDLYNAFGYAQSSEGWIKKNLW
jgi:hypothetical protein